MPLDAPKSEKATERSQRRKGELHEIRERARKVFSQPGVLGTQVASKLSESLDEYVIRVVVETLEEFPEAERREIAANSAMIAVGGSGRGEAAPYSDFDLLFVYRPQIKKVIDPFTKRVVPELWDAGIKLGQRILTVQETLRFSQIDTQLATALVHCRWLWGDEALSKQLVSRFYRPVVYRQSRIFINRFIESREKERFDHGAIGQQLEPDVKKSFGGLRDVHIILWIGFACYEAATIDDIRAKEAISQDDAQRLKAAVEFLTKIRIDMHLHANKGNDLLSKDEQLRIAAARGIEQTEAQRPVERLMQEYFIHSTAIAEISRRFIARHRQRSFGEWLHHSLMTRRVGRHFLLSPDELDISPSQLSKACVTLDDLLRIYHAAAMYRVRIAPRLLDAIKARALTLAPIPSPEAARLFMEILGATGRMADTIRSMHDTNVLELMIPEWKRVRCLLQFNQYHHFTVDEHTLRALAVCESFATEDTPLGAVYRDLKVRPLLHLSLLLHDAGKGYKEDHCDVGARMAFDVCQRLRLPHADTQTVSFLIQHHLQMADWAFRHDITDQRILLEFSHKLGTPERLAMLFLLTASDVSAVGPGVWSQFKADLLSSFYTGLNYILSGHHPKYHEEERLQHIREHVYRSIVPLGPGDNPDDLRQWLDTQLLSFSSYYLTTTAPSRIASDIDIIRNLQPGEIRVEGENDESSRSVQYRVVLDAQHSVGCFHVIAGVLTAKHLNILGAEITTNRDGVVVDVFHVTDSDYALPVPPHRITEIANTIRDALTKKGTVEQLFKRNKRIAMPGAKQPVMHLETRVVIDNKTSDRCTVVSVFAHDRPGLLFTIARTLFQLGVSVELAKIATHFDQVVDVFYVTDNTGQRIESEATQTEIQTRLAAELAIFEAEKHRDFVA
jgi:[protein-PII] uridylyltransferase